MIAALLALTLHVGDVELIAREQQITSPSIHVKTHSGDIYHVPVMPLDGGIFDGTEHLVYEENTINTCQAFELPAGIYRAELRGGSGGKPYRCNSGTGTIRSPGEYVSSVFKLNNATTLYALRGGDGNNSPTVTIHQIPGGGASGVDSILVVGNRTIRANGGPGAKCMNFNAQSYYDGSFALHSGRCAPGGGGNYSDTFINTGGNGYLRGSGGCAGAGGGSNVYGGGGGGNAISSSTLMSLGAGTPGTATGGGNGGNATNLLGTSMTKNNAVGGTGGKNVTYSCGGQTAVSYGGGGGGATCALRSESTCERLGAWCESDCADGGAGASGSTGTSETSFIKIYKIG